MPWRWRSALGFRILLAVLIGCVVVVSEYRPWPLLERFDEALKDALLRFAVDPAPETRIAVVDIDDNSIASIGPWPWSRARIADLIEVLLADYQVRGVGLDVVFPETRDPEGDLRLAALAEHAPLTLAQVFDFSPRYPALDAGVLAPPATDLVQGEAGVPAYGYLANHAGLRRARCVGNIGYPPDRDGVLRHIPLRIAFEGRLYPQFAVALLACAARPPFELALPASDRLWRIPFGHALEAYPVLSAADVLQREAPAELLRGRIVVIGSSSVGRGDLVGVPLASLVSGVMVHAQSLSALLDLAEGRIGPPWDGRPWTLLWFLPTAIAALFLIARLSAWRSLTLLLGLTCSWLLLACWGFLHQAEGSILAPVLGYLLLLAAAVPYEWRRSQQRSREALEILSHYVARPVLDELRRQGQGYSLAPLQKEVTVLIADMENHTRLVSTLSLDEAARLTREFLGCLTRPVLAHAGTLDKYSGDGLVAFWGAPLECPDQADRAVDAALDILEEVRLWNIDRGVRGQPAVRARIGIESGKALVGDLGTPFRSSYTAVGDCINFASRLESAARDRPFSIVIGEVANARLHRHATRAAGTLQVRGTTTTIEIFTPDGKKADASLP